MDCKKGSKGIHIEYWSVYDKLQKKNISIQEARDIIAADKDREEDLVWKHRDYSVFNASCIEGIPEYKQEKTVKLNDVQMNKLIDNIIKNMDVGYREFGDSAYYTPALDIVTMPPKISFFNEYEFNSTLLHELAHATGHESRLNRDIKNTFGSIDYAVEELRSGISSAFMSQYCKLTMTQEHIDNHKAYVQSWSQKIKDDPNILFKAINDAEMISDFMIEKGELEKVKTQEILHPSINEQIKRCIEIIAQTNSIAKDVNKDKDEYSYTL